MMLIISIWISLTIRLELENYNYKETFDMGYLCCLLQILGTIGLNRRSEIIIYSFLFTGVRAINFREWYTILCQTIIHFILCVVLLEKNDYENKQERAIDNNISKMSIYQELINCHVEKSIVLISKNMEKIYFKNTKFHSKFESKEILTKALIKHGIRSRCISLKAFLSEQLTKKNFNQKFEITYKVSQTNETLQTIASFVKYGNDDAILLIFEELSNPVIQEMIKEPSDTISLIFDNSIDALFSMIREFIITSDKNRPKARKLITNYFEIISKLAYSFESFSQSLGQTLISEKSTYDLKSFADELISCFNFYLSSKNTGIEFRYSENFPSRFDIDKKLALEILNLIIISFTRRLTSKLYIDVFFESEDLCFIISNDVENIMMVPRVRTPIFVEEHPFQYMMNSELIAYAGRIANTLLQQINTVSNEGLSRFDQTKFFFKIDNSIHVDTQSETSNLRSNTIFEISISGIEDENPRVENKLPISSRLKTPISTDREICQYQAETNRNILFDSMISTTSRFGICGHECTFLIADSDTANAEKISILAKLKNVNTYICKSTDDALSLIMKFKRSNLRLDMILIRCDKKFSGGLSLYKKLIKMIKKGELKQISIVGMSDTDSTSQTESISDVNKQNFYKIPLNENSFKELILRCKT